MAGWNYIQIIGEKKILSTARLLRIASGLPYLVQFWNKSENPKVQLTSKEMKEWIGHDGELVDTGPLDPHINQILSSSPKLAYIGTILDQSQIQRMDHFDFVSRDLEQMSSELVSSVRLQISFKSQPSHRIERTFPKILAQTSLFSS